jgi:hypothetical protein
MADTLPMLNPDVEKWKKITKEIKESYSELTVPEQSAFDVLCDFWRNSNFDPDECNENIRILAEESRAHGNNLNLKTELQSFRELCKKYYTKKEDYFKAFQKTLGGKPFVKTYAPPPPPKTEIPKTPPKTPPKKTPTQDNKQQRLDFGNGNYYIGEVRNGQPNGKGKYYYQSGSWTEGVFSNGELTGQGVYYDIQNSRTDTGQYINGNRTGKGSMKWDNGQWYTGEWNQSGANGYGTMFLPKWGGGATYKGQFVNHKRQGKGKVEFKNGNWYEGQWTDNEMTGQGSYYLAQYKRTDTGTFKDGDRVGQGVMKWDDGDRYEGTWDDSSGSLKGAGTYYYPNGSSEKGKWVDGEWVKRGSRPPSSSGSGSTNIFRRFGRFLWEYCEFFPWVICLLVTIDDLVKQGFWSAVFVGLLGAIVAAIVMYVIIFAKATLERIYYWFTSLSTAVKSIIGLILLGLVGYWIFPSVPYLWKSPAQEPPAQVVTTNQPNYYCTAKEYITVRTKPNSSAQGIGKIKKNEQFYVYEIDPATNFATIDFEGKKGYVNAEYIKEIKN